VVNPRGSGDGGTSRDTGPTELISRQHLAGNLTEPGHTIKEATVPRTLLYYLAQTWATDPHHHPRPLALARKKGTPAMSDRFAAHWPPAIRNLSARTRRLTISAAAAITIGAVVAIPALLAAPARPGNAVLAGHSGPVFSVAFSPDGKILAGAGDTSMRLWDMATRRPIGHRLTGSTGGVISVAFSPDGKTLAGGGGAQGVRLWDVGTGRQIRNQLTGHTGPVGSVAFSPDGKTLAGGGGAHGVRLWDLASGRQIGDLPTGHTNWVGSVAFSPDGKALADGGGYDGLRSRVWLWDLASGRVIGHRLTRSDGGIGSVAFSPDGKTLATASGDGTVRLWDVTTGHPVRDLVTGHTNGVYSVVVPVAFSPDGKTLASGSSGGTVRLWDLATYRQIGKPLTGHTGPVTSVAFSPDGKTLASASVDGTVRLWGVATHRQISGATTVTGPPANGTTATTNGMENKSPWEVLRAAAAAVGAAKSVRIVGSNLDGPFDYRLQRSSAIATITLTRTEHVWIRAVGRYGYKKTDLAITLAGGSGTPRKSSLDSPSPSSPVQSADR
jgi:WD40 repeat protein